MQETLHGHHTSISIVEMSICNLQFADDIDLMGGSNGELKDLTNRLADRAREYEMEVSTEKKSMIMSCTNNITAGLFPSSLR